MTPCGPVCDDDIRPLFDALRPTGGDTRTHPDELECGKDPRQLRQVLNIFFSFFFSQKHISTFTSHFSIFIKLSRVLIYAPVYNFCQVFNIFSLTFTSHCSIFFHSFFSCIFFQFFVHVFSIFPINFFSIFCSCFFNFSN